MVCSNWHCGIGPFLGQIWHFWKKSTLEKANFMDITALQACLSFYYLIYSSINYNHLYYYFWFNTSLIKIMSLIYSN